MQKKAKASNWIERSGRVLVGGLVMMLTLGLFNPAVGEGAFADDTPSPQDDAYKPSLVTISFDSSNEHVTLIPNDEVGQTTAVEAKASISVENSGGYSIYVSSHTSNLVGRSDKNNVIPSITQASTLANLPVNTWGYYAGEGTTVPEGAEYKAMPIAINTGTPIYSNSASRIRQETKDIVLSFAARINKYVKADVYENEVTLSVVSNPRKVAGFNDIETMQELTPSICKAAMENEMAYLKDSRDGNYYWVTKLADGNCWMSQNLALDLTKDVPIEASIINEDGSMGTFEYVPEESTRFNHDYTIETPGVDVSDSTAVFKYQNEHAYYSWDEGKYVLKEPAKVVESLPSTKEDGGIEKYANLGIVINVGGEGWRVAEDANFTAMTTYRDGAKSYPKVAGLAIDETRKVYDAHYLVGNYYQWLAATALTMEQGIAAGNGFNSASSICPENWRIPLSRGIVASYEVLKSAYGLTGTALVSQNASASPLFITVSGNTDSQTGRVMLGGVGTAGRWWTGSVSNTPRYAYDLTVSDTVFNVAQNDKRLAGFSVRCLVLTEE